MKKELLISFGEPGGPQVVLLEDGRMEEFSVDPTSAPSTLGNIYKGRISNIEPALQAAFVDIGRAQGGIPRAGRRLIPPAMDGTFGCP